MPDDDSPDLPSEALARHCRETQKIVADFIERGEQSAIRSQKEIDAAHKSLIDDIDQMVQRVIDAGYTEEELYKLIEAAVDALQEEEREESRLDTLSVQRTDNETFNCH